MEIAVVKILSGPRTLAGSERLYVLADLLVPAIGIVVKGATVVWDQETGTCAATLPDSCEFANPFMKQVFASFATQAVLVHILNNSTASETKDVAIQ